MSSVSLIVTTVVTISSTGKKHSAANVMRIIFAHGSMIVQLQIIMRNTHTHTHTQEYTVRCSCSLLSVRVSHKGDTCVVYLEAVVLIAAQVHITLFAFHGGFPLFEWVVLVGYPWSLSFMMFVSCIAHDTDVVFALSSHGPVVCTIQSWVTFVGCTVWSADLMFLHIVISNQLMSQVQSERQKITLHYISHLVIDDMSLDDVSVV